MTQTGGVMLFFPSFLHVAIRIRDRLFPYFVKKIYASNGLWGMVLGQRHYGETLTGLAYYKKGLYFHIGKWVDLRRKAPIVGKENIPALFVTIPRLKIRSY